MAVVSPRRDPDWSFPAVCPFDSPIFAAHPDRDHPSPHTHKRRAHEVHWDDDDIPQRPDARAKKPKTSPSPSPSPDSLAPAVHPPSSSAPSPHIKLISILVGALTSAPPATQHAPPPDPPITVLPSQAPAPSPPSRPAPTSPLSNSPHRAPFVRKVIGGSCAGKTEPSLYRWVLCKNHFLRVRYVDPATQSAEWVQTLRDMGWEELYPSFQPQTPQTLGALHPFSRWIEDDFDYDAAEDIDSDWSDEDEDVDVPEDIPEHDGDGQTAVWDSGIVLQLPGKSS